MTRVIIGGVLLAYRRHLPRVASRLLPERFITGLRAWSPPAIPLARENLLPPPRIEAIYLRFYHGQVDDMILMDISDDSGVVNVHVTLHDAAGKRIESGDAVPDPEYSGCWASSTTARVPSGISVRVHAAATDRLGGVGALSTGGTVR